MVVLMAALMFFTSVMTPVHAESASEEPIETPTEEVEETPVEQPAETPAEEVKETPVEQPAEAVEPEVTKQDAAEPEENANEQIDTTPVPTDENSDGSDNVTVDILSVNDLVENAVESIEASLATDANADTEGLTATNGEEPEIDDAPEANKTLTYNGNGTSTLSLSVVGQADSKDDVQKSNVLIMLDRSNSMKIATEYTFDENTYNDSYQYYRSTTYDWNVGGNVPSNRIYHDENGWYYTGNWGSRVDYTGTVYVSRLCAAQMAINVLVTKLLDMNTSKYPDLIEVKADNFGSIRGSYLTFQGGQSIESPWVSGKGNTTAIMPYVNANYTFGDYGGTNWQTALEYSKEELNNKKKDDPSTENWDESTEQCFVIFVTDGDPTLYGSGTETYGSGNSYDRTAHDYANTAAYSLLNGTGHKLFSIFAFGSGDTSANHLRETTFYGYNGRKPGTDKEQTSLDNENFFDAKKITALVTAFEDIIKAITNAVAFGEVAIEDGVSQDVTVTTLAPGKAAGFKYTVKDENEAVAYTVTAVGDNNPTVTFYDAAGKSYASEAKTDDKGRQYYSATIDGKECKIALASVNDKGLVEWDLSAIGTLENGYEYTLSFIVWPDQEAYDYVAKLNNGEAKWNKDTEQEVKDKEGNGLGYYNHGSEDYPNIIRTPGVDGAPDTYSILTNTSQEITYAVAHTVTDDTGSHTTYDEPVTIGLDPAKPMDLTASHIQIEKVWNHDLDKKQLAELMFGPDFETAPKYTNHKVVLKVTTDTDKEGKTFTFPKLNANGQPVDKDNNPATDIDSLVWSTDLCIAPGIMLSKDEATRIGLDTTGYTKVVIDGKDHFVLPQSEGHNYYVEEVDGQDLHFEYNSIVYHPMLVDGTLKNVKFGESETAEIVGDDPLTTIKGTNSLKGGIDIRKEVYSSDRTTKVEDCKDEFAFKVTLWSEDEKGKKSPVYTTEDQFNEDRTPASGSMGYRVYEDKEFKATAASDTTWTIKDGENDITITYDDSTGNYTGSDKNSYTPNEDKSVFTRRDRLQRDAIYAGTKPAKVTIGEETTEMIFTMQANQYCQIVNVPSGTKYTVEEIQSDGKEYNHFYSSSTVREIVDGTSTDKTNEKKTDETSLTDHTIDGYVSANYSTKVLFKNWAANFYVYHSSNNTVEKISFADKRVKGTYDATVDPETQKPVGYKYTFNIVDETKDGTLYGGYYKAYKSAKVTNDQIIGTASEGNLKYTKDETTNRYWSRDTVKAPYTGDIAGIWKKSEAYTDKVQATGGGTGTAMTPVANTVYYLKEVPNGYIRPYIHYVYDDYRDDKPLKQLYLITASDDTNYTSVGYMVTKGDAKEPTMITTKASLLISFTSPTRGKTTLKVKTIWDDKEYHGDKVKLNRGYLYSTNCSDVINSTVTFRPCWTTLDKVLVQGVTVRKVTNITTKNDITVDDQKAVD